LTGFLKRNYNITANDTTTRIASLNSLIKKNENELVNRLYEDRLSHLKNLRGGSLWATYGKGWSRRLDELKGIASSGIYKIQETAISAKEVVKKNPYKIAALTIAIALTAFVGYKLIIKNK
jgi:lysozyme family protein